MADTQSSHSDLVHATYHLAWHRKSGAYVQFQARQTTNLVMLLKYEGWNFNTGNYLFTTDTK